MQGMVELDPNYEWIECSTLDSSGVEYMQGRCNHLHVVSVESVTGEVVAQLCTVCDQQLPAWSGTTITMQWHGNG